MILDQIRRIRAAHDAQVAALQARITELEATADPAVQAELDAFEAEVTPQPPVAN